MRTKVGLNTASGCVCVCVCVCVGVCVLESVCVCEWGYNEDLHYKKLQNF